MAGYTRQDTANNIANGNVIDADDFDAEYNSIEGAFNSTSGHTHDGTSGEGAPITKVGPVQDLIVSSGAVMPKSTNTLDLGSAEVQYKNAYFDGLVNTDTLSVDENATVSGTLGVTGVTTLSNNLNVTGATGIDGNFDINTNKFTVASSTGNTAIAGTLAVTGATGIDGNFDINTNKFTVNATTGNTAVAGTLGVTGATTLSSTLGVTGTTNLGGALNVTGTTGVDGNFDVATNKFTVDSQSGNTNVAGVLAVTGNINGSSGLNVTGNAGIDGNFDINTNKFTVAATTGNTTVAGTLAAAGNTTVGGTLGVTGNTTVGGTLAVTGASTLTGAVSAPAGITGNVTGNLTGNVTGNITGNVTSTGANTMASLTTTGNVVVGGNLTISGTTTTVNTETVNIADNLILLNSNYTGSSPTENGGIEIERGTLANKSFIWDETNDRWSVGSDTFYAGSIYPGRIIGNSSGYIYNVPFTGTGGGTFRVWNDADMGDPILGVDIDLTSSGATIQSIGTGAAEALTLRSSTFTVDASSSITLDAGGGVIYFKDDGVQRGAIDIATASTLKFSAGTTEEMRLTSSGMAVQNGLYVGSVTGVPTDNDIYAEADITANNNVTANNNMNVGNDIIMSAGASNWKFEVGASNELNIYYGATKLFKLDSSGNLNVRGDITAFDTGI
jgi:hypothetical protein